MSQEVTFTAEEVALLVSLSENPLAVVSKIAALQARLAAAEAVVEGERWRIEWPDRTDRDGVGSTPHYDHRPSDRILAEWAGRKPGAYLVRETPLDATRTKETSRG